MFLGFSVSDCSKLSFHLPSLPKYSPLLRLFQYYHTFFDLASQSGKIIVPKFRGQNVPEFVQSDEVRVMLALGILQEAGVRYCICTFRARRIPYIVIRLSVSVVFYTQSKGYFLSI